MEETGKYIICQNVPVDPDDQSLRSAGSRWSVLVLTVAGIVESCNRDLFVNFSACSNRACYLSDPDTRRGPSYTHELGADRICRRHLTSLGIQITTHIEMIIRAVMSLSHFFVNHPP